MEMNKIKLTEIGQRCNESTKLVNDKEILLKEVKQKLEDMQKENERLKQQITEQEHVRKSSEQEIGVVRMPIQPSQSNLPSNPFFISVVYHVQLHTCRKNHVCIFFYENQPLYTRIFFL